MEARPTASIRRLPPVTDDPKTASSMPLEQACLPGPQDRIPVYSQSVGLGYHEWPWRKLEATWVAGQHWPGLECTLDFELNLLGAVDLSEELLATDPRRWAKPAHADEPHNRIPFHDLLGMWPREVAGGKAVIELTVGPQHLRAGTILHGGVFAALLDAAQGMAAASLAPPDHDLVTAQLGLNFIRPARVGDTLIALGEVQHAGRKTAVTRGEIRSSKGTLLATGTATLLYLPMNPGVENRERS